ncbi:MAG: hypothetical protein JO352_11245 [Chloroflexi bacterium]|nr:hypothetical protein [Chloroflexota bacterium]MBV9601966.1 hypothetical protein [Chloroflexota bacterium]
MMVILDNDLVNVIQAERREHAARERASHESTGAARDQAPLLSFTRRTTAWLRTQAAVLLLGVSAGQGSDQVSPAGDWRRDPVITFARDSRDADRPGRAAA